LQAQVAAQAAQEAAQQAVADAASRAFIAKTTASSRAGLADDTTYLPMVATCKAELANGPSGGVGGDPNAVAGNCDALARTQWLAGYRTWQPLLQTSLRAPSTAGNSTVFALAGLTVAAFLVPSVRASLLGLFRRR
jgi:hypothetical protein